MRARSFLARHWQKEALFLPGAITGLSPTLEPEELAWLATQPDVESRLIYTEHNDGNTTYRVESGPFDDELLSNLPECDWTLLVQDVDKHLPDFAQLFSLTAFIPDWRIDDLMISFAAPGGSVGPHMDNYDVFLCQGSGQREWRLANADEATVSDTCEQLALLKPFTDPRPQCVEKGDVLYLPPGIPHWGIAMDACMTYSIGMRAPELDELRLCFEREFPDSVNPFFARPDHQPVFYRDPDLSPEEAVPGQLSPQSVARCRDLIPDTSSIEDRVLAITLGCVATDVKAWLAPETPSLEELRDFLGTADLTESIAVHGMSRLAWWAGDDELHVFANGCNQSTALHHLDFVKDLCASRNIDGRLLISPTRSELVEWLLNVGAFDLFAND